MEYKFLTVNRTGGWMTAAAIFACVGVTEVVAEQAPSDVARLVAGRSSAGSAELTNASASIGPRTRAAYDYVLDSPNFEPVAARQLAAAGFARKNRWS